MADDRARVIDLLDLELDEAGRQVDISEAPGLFCYPGSRLAERPAPEPLRLRPPDGRRLRRMLSIGAISHRFWARRP